jgi:hypothetical protein
LRVSPYWLFRLGDCIARNFAKKKGKRRVLLALFFRADQAIRDKVLCRYSIHVITIDKRHEMSSASDNLRINAI